MSHPDAARWDARYTDESEFWLSKLPHRLLREHATLLPAAGIALDAASGIGTNSLFLAERGLRVIAVDISEVALRAARQRAAARALPVVAAVYDLAEPWLPPDHFDVIVNFHFLERGALPVYRSALKPGGLLFFETFLKTGPESSHPDYYLNPGELRAAFEGFEALHWQERRIPEVEKLTEELVARKRARER